MAARPQAGLTDHRSLSTIPPHCSASVFVPAASQHCRGVGKGKRTRFLCPSPLLRCVAHHPARTHPPAPGQKGQAGQAATNVEALTSDDAGNALSESARSSWRRDAHRSRRRTGHLAYYGTLVLRAVDTIAYLPLHVMVLYGILCR